MTDARDGRSTTTPVGESDILAELETEVAHDLEEDHPPAGGPAYQVVGAAVTLLIGAVGAVLAYGYGLGSLREPGPGLWPFMVSLAIAILSAVLLLVGRGLTDSEALTRSSMHPAIGVVTLLAVGLLMPVVGFEIPALALCIVWLRFLGGETWRSAAVVGTLTTAAFYVLFLYALQVPLPHLF
jgi:putative tricarboxylic transport membrane protein